MAIFEIKYGTSGQAITITLASLAAAAARESTALDNTADLALDVLVALKVKLQTGTAGDFKSVNVYVYGTVDGGTTYPDAVTGTDAAITLDSPPNLRLLGVISAPTSAGTFKGGPWSVAAAFGGNIPAKWGIVVENRTNIAFDATESNHVKKFQEIQSQSA